MIAEPAILITDDDLEFRDTLRAVIEPEGYRTLLAGDGEQAIEILHNEEVHLLLADIHMPGISGLDVVRLAREFKALLPCILLSANLTEALRREAEMLETFSVLSKPVTRQQICEVVETALQWAYNWPDNEIE